MIALVFALLFNAVAAQTVVATRIGAIAVGKYYDFPISSDWSAFDQIQLKVHNPGPATAVFYLSVADDKSEDYWSKLNHKTTLAPGWNVLSFPLSQWLGERGSHRHQRPLDLRKLKKFFMLIEGPDQRYFVEDVKLVADASAPIPKNLRAFDFTVDALKTQTRLTAVTEADAYSQKKGFGFMEGARFWRSEDAIYAPATLRATIGVLDGSFRVDLPNGRYGGELIWERMGYWDPSFWKRRFVQLNQKPLRLETRSTKDAYLKDLLKFLLPPTSSSNLHDAFFTTFFAPVEFEFEVTEGRAVFAFEGDATGVSLNRLLLWPVTAKAEAQSYRRQLREFETLQWQREARQITRAPLAPRTAGVVAATPRLSSQQALAATPTLRFRGGKGTRPQQVLQLPAGEYRWSLSELVHPTGKKISANLELHQVEARDVAVDMNHETFERVGKVLVVQNAAELKLKDTVNYLWLTLAIGSTWESGEWKGSLVLQGKKPQTIPVILDVQSYQLPKAAVSVGFFHLLGLPPAYFDDPQLKTYHQQLRISALKLLARFGFTAFSALPSDERELKELLKTARDLGFLSAYTYGGQYLAAPAEIPEREAELINNFIEQQNKSTPKIVLTFSDEPNGYQSRLAADTEVRRRLRKLFPKVPLSAFSSMEDEAADVFNQNLDVGFYTKADDWKLKTWQRQGHQWGAYNGAPGNFDDPRFGFGVGLFLATRAGLTHFLEWQANNNYPYFELDGREGDVSAWLPLADGTVRPTVRFMLAAQGLETYRKLLAIAARAEKQDKLGEELQEWLTKLADRYKIFQAPRLLKNENFSYESFEKELDEKLKNII
jgi:hypothetical protein